jgi:hypothetical protein
MDVREPINYMALMRYGEDLLTEILQKLQEVILVSRQVSGVPLDRTQLQNMSRRLQIPLEEHLKVLPVLFKRMKIIERLLNDLIDSLGAQPAVEVWSVTTFLRFLQSNNQSLPVFQELIPLRVDPVGALPATFEEEMRAKVQPELWREYLDLKEKLCRRDTYIKTIIDTERAILLEINCITQPWAKYAPFFTVATSMVPCFLLLLVVGVF